jgi:hypothetical protein
MDYAKFKVRQLQRYVQTFDRWAEILIDFDYIKNNDGTATITGWKGTLNGEPSTELIIPDDERIIL